MRVRRIRFLCITLALLAWTPLSGCQPIRYYSQAIQGQYHILSNRRPICDIIADPGHPATLRERLSYILGVREFAKNELQLPVKNHYRSYVELKRSHVAWNVFAAPEFSLEPRTWCYPIVGCAAYRGYFSEKNAHRYADMLRKQGYDVYVGGVTAYSTLGWFDDPVLSSFIQLSEARTAALIFHELAHQVVYLKDDTAFNESFATAVEQEGLRRWQNASGDPQMYSKYEQIFVGQRQFVRLIETFRRQLKVLYQSDLTELQKREKKARVFADLRNEFNRLKAEQIELSVYDAWINAPLNNAQIISVAAYHDFVPAFHTMINANDGNLHRFYQACLNLGQKKKGERHRILNTYMQRQRSTIDDNPCCF